MEEAAYIDFDCRLPPPPTPPPPKLPPNPSLPPFHCLPVDPGRYGRSSWLVDFQEEKSRGRTVQEATLKRYFCNGFGVKVGCPCCGWNPTTLSLSLRILSEIKTFYVSSTQSLVVTTSTNLWTDRLFDLLCLINWYKKSLHPLVNIWRTGGPGHHGPVWGPFQITQ